MNLNICFQRFYYCVYEIQNLSFFADDNRDMTEPCRAPILFIPNNKYYFVQHNYNV